MFWNYIAVILGGGVGCAARYGMTELVQAFWGRTFPVATLAINVLGSFAMGFLFFATLERLSVHPAVRVALLSGVLGGFTTFSTFMMESLLLVEDGHAGKALAYVVLSVVLGFAAAVSGVYLSRNM